MQEELLHIFPLHLRETLQKVTMKENTLEEIRIRIGQPVIFHMENEEWYLKKETGRLERSQVNAYCATKEDIKSMVKFISSYSLYAYENEMKRGFITMQGGHRIGVAGQVVMDGGKVLSLSNIYFLNIRVAREKRGCAKDIIPYLIHRNSIYNTLFVSPPGIGKTTYLRDAIRILSNGSDRLHGMKISIIDERSEIAACRQGIPQNDIGIRSDVLDGCLKSFGMLLMLRFNGTADHCGGRDRKQGGLPGNGAGHLFGQPYYRDRTCLRYERAFEKKIPERNVRTADVWQDRPLRKSRKWQEKVPYL